RGIQLGDSARCRDPVQLLHRQVHHHHVRREARHLFQRSPTVVGFPDHVHVRRGAEHGLETGAHHGVVVYQKYTNRTIVNHTCSGWSSGTRARTIVPIPGALSIVASPPTNPIRSRIANSPIPGRRRSASPRSKPFPSSVTSRTAA